MPVELLMLSPAVLENEPPVSPVTVAVISEPFTQAVAALSAKLASSSALMVTVCVLEFGQLPAVV